MIKINSIDDLANEKVKELAKFYQLDVKKILSLYIELEKELQRNGGEIEIDFSDPSIPLNVHDSYLKKVMAGLVVCSELAEREEVRFPLDEGVVLDPIERTSAAFNLRGILHRTQPASTYMGIGQAYVSVLRFIEVHRARCLIKLGED